MITKTIDDLIDSVKKELNEFNEKCFPHELIVEEGYVDWDGKQTKIEKFKKRFYSEKDLINYCEEKIDDNEFLKYKKEGNSYYAKIGSKND